MIKLGCLSFRHDVPSLIAEQLLCRCNVRHVKPCQTNALLLRKVRIFVRVCAVTWRQAALAHEFLLLDLQLLGCDQPVLELQRLLRPACGQPFFEVTQIHLWHGQCGITHAQLSLYDTQLFAPFLGPQFATKFQAVSMYPLGNIFFEPEAYDTWISLVQNTENNMHMRMYNPHNGTKHAAAAKGLQWGHLSMCSCSGIHSCCTCSLVKGRRCSLDARRLWQNTMAEHTMAGLFPPPFWEAAVLHVHLWKRFTTVFVKGFSRRFHLRMSLSLAAECQGLDSLSTKNPPTPANENHVLTHKQHTCHIAIAVHGGWGYCHAEREKSIRNWKRVKTQHPDILYIYIRILLWICIHLIYNHIYLIHITYMCTTT